MAESPRIINAVSDIAMVGVWDVERDREPFETWKSARQNFEADALAGHLFYVEGDGGETAIFVDEEVPESILEYMRPLGDWFLLQAPTGRLCCGGLEDYRARKKKITDPSDDFTVPPGDYRVHCHAIDYEIPARQLAEHLGEEDYQYWKAMDRRVDRSCNIVAGVFVLCLIVGWFASWWVAGAMAAIAVLSWFAVDAGRGRDPRYQELFDRVSEFTGELPFEEFEEKFQEDKLCLAFELRRLTGAYRPPGGFVRLEPTSEAAG